MKVPSIRWAILSCALLPHLIVSHDKIPLDQAAKDKIVNIHNDERDMLYFGAISKYPQALYQPHLVWDDTLAASAGDDRLACTLNHLGHFPVGENIAARSEVIAADASSDFIVGMVEKMTNQWLIENEAYDYDPVTLTTGCRASKTNPIKASDGSDITACGHYTQMIWGDTQRIGCAVTSSCDSTYKTYMICHYSPPGNLKGSAPYYKYEDLPASATGDNCFLIQCNTMNSASNGLYYKDGDLYSSFPSSRNKFQIRKMQSWGGIWAMAIGTTGTQMAVGWCAGYESGGYGDPTKCNAWSAGQPAGSTRKPGFWKQVNCQKAFAEFEQPHPTPVDCSAQSMGMKEEKEMNYAAAPTFDLPVEKSMNSWVWNCVAFMVGVMMVLGVWYYKQIEVRKEYGTIDESVPFVQ